MKIINALKKGIIPFIVLILVSPYTIAQKDESAGNITWETQVASLAATYGLDAKNTAKLSKAYVSVRAEISKKNLSSGKEDDPAAYKANSELNEKAGREKIQKVTGKILGDKQAEEAAFVLGSFSPRWDTYQEVLLGLKLEKKELGSSSEALAEYMKLYLKARKTAADSGERFSGHTASELKSNLDRSLSEFLNPEQLTSWNQATQRKRKGE